MHLNFGVINDKVSNILAVDNSNYEIAISYAKCDFDSHNQNNSSINVSDSSDIDYKESILNSKDEINRNLNLSFDYVIHENGILSQNEEKLCVAVRVHNLCFSYSKSSKILQNCSINVVEGNIYALLGSSGCGKTTLLRCILGRLKPNSGDINVFGFKPNAPNSTIPGPGVGYMPQELALFGENTIKDTFIYFGRLYHMKRSEIDQKIEFLLKFLHLPSKTKLISQLSGGQQRSVSLSVALLNSPKLLILDEPTVGVDPVLRQRIWIYLQQLCREGITIIITTHYIEEARNATTVGLMRGGRLLAEQNPELLMKRHDCKTLEEVFLKLCQFNENKTCREVKVNDLNCIENSEKYSDDFFYSGKLLRNNFEKYHNSLNFSQFFSWFRVWAVFCKTWYKLNGNPILLFAYLLPSIQMSIFCLSVGKDPRGLKIAIHNEESPQFLTQQFLNFLDNNTFIQNKFDSLESATNAVIDGNSWAAISMSANFSKCLKIRTRKGTEAKNAVIECSNIKLIADMSNSVIGVTLIKSIAQSLQKFVQNYLIKLGYNPNTISLPFKTEEVIYGSFEPSVQDFMAPEWYVINNIHLFVISILELSFDQVIALIFFAPFSLTALTLLDERIYGVFERSLVAGVKAIEILFAHLLIQLSILLFEVCFMALTIFYIWQIPNCGSLWEVLAIVFLQGVSGITFGLLIASVVNDKVYAFVVGLGIIFPSWVVCGVFWPIESMPPFMKSISYFLPLTYPIESMRFIMFRGWDFTHLPVILGFISSFAYIITFFTGAVILFKWFI